MCYMAAIPIAMAVVSSVVSTATKYNDAKAQNRTLEYNAAVGRQNADLERQQASYARAQASRNANQERIKAAQLVGAQRARMGASGAAVDSGSFLDVTLSTAEQGERDAVALLQQGDVEAWRHNVQAANYERQAQLQLASKVNTKAVLTGGVLSGVAKVGMSAFMMSGFMGGADAAGGIFGSADLGMTQGGMNAMFEQSHEVSAAAFR